MAEKFLAEKRRLRDFLVARGVEYDEKNKTWKCPGHNDEHPSAHLYEDQDPPRLYCPVCAESWTVIDVAGHLDGLTEFKDMLKAVRDTLHITPPTRKREPLALPIEEAKKIYTEERVYELVKDKIPGKIVGKWPYHTVSGDIIGIDIRFEADGKKTVLTFWYDGHLRFAKAPVLIYNLKEVVKNAGKKPILIHEGAKCAEASRNLDGFIPASWSGGSAKAKLADWHILGKSDIYIFPDDDDPGIKAAHKIREQIPQAKIIRPIPAARAIKPKGADIEEALQVMSADDLTAYILNPENHESIDMGPDTELPAPAVSNGDVPPSSPGPVSMDSLPFKILGIGDDGRAAFISEAGRLVKYGLDSLSKNKLMVLAGRWFWRDNYASEGKMSWDWAIDDMIRFSQDKDFNDADVRGRGAWRDGDKISYHDGVKTYGDRDPKKIYLRLPKRDIGINDAPAISETCSALKDTIFRLSFETRADAVRTLAWAALAPFAGALKFRPAILLTGPSGSGKTTVATFFINRLANPMWINGSETTPAYVRQKVGTDATSIVIDEMEADSEKKRRNRDELLSLMRASTSDDAPDSGKGGKDNNPVSFKMKNMFAFLSIDPTLESVADENRIFRINIVKPKNGNEWKSIEKILLGLLSDENCRAIRALVWKKLNHIFTLSDRVVDSIREKTGKDYRSSYADAMLCSTFMIVWSGIDSPTDAQINETLDKYYQFQPAEEHRDEAEEFVDRILGEHIEILHDHNREKISIIECMNRVYNGRRLDGDEATCLESEINSYRLTLSRHGIIVKSRSFEPGEIAIHNNHFFIKKLAGCGTGYHRIFNRHKGYVITKNIHFLDGKTYKATVLKGLLSKQDPPVTINDIPVEEFDFQ